MIKQKKSTVFRALLAILVIFAANLTLYSRVVLNRGDCAYDDECEKAAVSMKTLIVQGAGYFLNSNSDMLQFLNRIEMSDLNGINYTELSNIINSAIENMEKAKDAYYNLKQKADNTPYNRWFIERLLTFDYAGFQVKKGLNASIYNDVIAYLSRGDVTGVFGHILAKTGVILNKLYIIKALVDANTFPEMSILWRINQDFSEVTLFGQFGAEIFYEVTGNTKNACD